MPPDVFVAIDIKMFHWVPGSAIGVAFQDDFRAANRKLKSASCAWSPIRMAIPELAASSDDKGILSGPFST